MMLFLVIKHFDIPYFHGKNLGSVQHALGSVQHALGSVQHA